MVMAGAVALAACRPCDLHVHGVCVAYDPGMTVGSEEHWAAAIENGAAFWRHPVSDLDGWTVAVHPDTFRCYGARVSGCTDPIVREMEIKVSHGCDAWHLAHEMGHALHSGDPFHWAGGWDRVEDAEVQWHIACDVPSY
jgi:hypothetical protein